MKTETKHFFLAKYWQKLTPLTQFLFVFAIINTVLNLTLLTVSLPNWKDTSIYPVLRFLLFRQSRDSWDDMNTAIVYFWSHPENTIYSEIFFKQEIKFQYPPTSLLIFYPLKLIASLLQFMNISQYTILNGLSWVAILVTAWFAVKIFNFNVDKNESGSMKPLSRVDLIVKNIILFYLALMFYPIMKAYDIGQIQVWINCIFSILFWCWMSNRKAASGILGGITCLIKPQYSIIFLWSILRRQWIFSRAFAISSLTIILISILMFGLANHIDYFSVLSFISKHGEGYYPNQSFNGLFNRLLFNGNNLIWDPQSFPPFHSLVYIETVVSSVLLISIAMLQPNKKSQRGSAIDLAIVALTCTLASPIAWEHHYGITLPIYAFLISYSQQKNIGKTMYFCLCTSYLLSSNYFGITKNLAYAQFNLNIFQSYLLMGGLILMVCLYWLRDGKTAEVNENGNIQS